MSKCSLGGGSSSSISTPRVWGMGARTPWLCAGVCVEGGGKRDGKGERWIDSRYATKREQTVTTYNNIVALQLVYQLITK